jgi:hypothetical protein
MNILTEIIETADNMMHMLIETGFFKDFPMVSSVRLRRKMEIQMQYNWEQVNNIHLSESQFVQCVTESVLDTIDELVQGGVILTRRDTTGKSKFSINPLLMVCPN